MSEPQLKYDPTRGEREIVFWSCDPCAETLRCVTVDEAMEDYLDGIDKEQWPAELRVEGYARITAHLDPDNLLEKVIKELDEEYNGGDESSTPTARMRGAALEFVSIVLSEYVVWNCEVMESRTVDVMSWVREHRPSWLPEIS